MPKRTFWLFTGAAIGAGSSLWAERKVRRSVQETAARLQPDAMVIEVGRSARQAAGTAGQRVRDAVTTGRSEMQRREEELWADLATQRLGSVPSATAGPDGVTRSGSGVGAAAPAGGRGVGRGGGRLRARRVLIKSASDLDK